ncbi:MAG: hypothetical protein ABSH56_14735 [Bryobacteraceae bacterium]|jgi:uncharacterized protein (DUF433 family)
MIAASNIAACPRLTRDEVSEIRQMFRGKAGMQAITEKFGLTREHVLAVCRYGRPQHSRNEATKRTN